MANADMVEWVNRFYDTWNKGEMTAFYQMIDEHVVDHDAYEPGAGLAGVKQTLDHFRSAFPDLHYKVEKIISDGDTQAAVRLTTTGTHKGALYGSPATNKQATWTEMRIIRVVNGKLLEHWANTDTLEMSIQLGLIQPPGGASW